MFFNSYNYLGDKMKLSELSIKDVIRDEDGTKLGKIEDITIEDITKKLYEKNDKKA